MAEQSLATQRRGQRSQAWYTPILPGELWDHIIDHLFDDSASLAACSLVCRGWLHTARVHLFRSITIAGDYAHLEGFEQLLMRSPHIARYIRKLKISESLNMTYRWLGFLSRSRLDRLEDLTARSTRGMPNVSQNNWDTLHCVLPMVKSIDITGFWDYDVQRLLLICPDTSSLTLGVTYPSMTGPLAPTPFRHSFIESMYRQTSVITSLTFRNSLNDLVAWLLEGPVKLHLRKLEIIFESRSPTSVPFAGKLLQASAASLEHIELARIDNPDTDSFNALQLPKVLAQIRQLITLRLSLNMSAIVDASEVFQRLCSALSGIRSVYGHLRHISITIWPGHLSPQCFDWDQLDIELARLVQEHPELIVTIVLRRDRPFPTLCEVVDSMLNGLWRVHSFKCRLVVLWFNGYEFDLLRAEDRDGLLQFLD